MEVKRKMGNYNLKFISDENLFKHVKETVDKYRFQIDLKSFNKNLIDPIKLTFDMKIYNKKIEEIIESEVLRQIDKSNTNHIGYFHQNIFNYFDNWEIPAKGFDVVNQKERIFVEMKNKHNTMNSSSSQKTYMRMQNKILENPANQCFLVEVIAKESQDKIWELTLDDEKVSHERIRRVSIDKFYEIVTGEKYFFRNLLQVLPKVLDDIVKERKGIENSVLEELKSNSPNILKSLHLLAFQKYEGFKDFNL
jgi:hypothetical protein